MSREHLDHHLPEWAKSMSDCRSVIDAAHGAGKLVLLDEDRALPMSVAVDTLRSTDLSRDLFQRFALTVSSDVLRRVIVAERLDANNTKAAISVRAGLVAVQAFLNLLPGIEIGFDTQTRNEQTLKAASNPSKLGRFDGSTALCFDPMLATGGSAIALSEAAVDRGAQSVIFASLLAAPQGAAALLHWSEENNVNLRLYIPGFDAGLNEQGFIVPGLGDFGDRCFGPANEHSN